MNKTAIITGGTKGIGLGIAQSLLDDGYNVVITSRTESSAQEIANTLKTNKDNRAIGLGCDVRDYNSQVACVTKTKELFGSIDVVIANAGVGHFSPIEEMSVENWNATIDTNLTGVFYSTKASIDALKESKGFTQSVMLDLRKYGIKVTTIMPGSVATHFNGNTPSDQDNWKIQPEDLGQMVSDLLKINPRTLPSKIEVRPTIPGGSK